MAPSQFLKLPLPGTGGSRDGLSWRVSRHAVHQAVDLAKAELAAVERAHEYHHGDSDLPLAVAFPNPRDHVRYFAAKPIANDARSLPSQGGWGLTCVIFSYPPS
jgi:hypothetical protein